MSQNCHHIKFPLDVDPISKSHASGSGENENDIISDKNILNLNDQGQYLNKCTTNKSLIPYVNVVYLSNVRKDVVPDNEINLTSKYLKWCDFFHLFFNKNGAFDISQTNKFDSAISFNNQTFETTFDKQVEFNLADQVKKTWSTKNSKPISNISIKNNIILNKNIFFIQSINSAVNYTGLTLEQTISTLLSSGKIETCNYKTSASVRFVMSYLYYFEPLDTSVVVNFNYITKIPCLKNRDDYSSLCDNPYSIDETCRSIIDFDDETTLGTIFTTGSCLYKDDDQTLDTTCSMTSSLYDDCSIMDNISLLDTEIIKTQILKVGIDDDS